MSKKTLPPELTEDQKKELEQKMYPDQVTNMRVPLNEDALQAFREKEIEEFKKRALEPKAQPPREESKLEFIDTTPPNPTQVILDELMHLNVDINYDNEKIAFHHTQKQFAEEARDKKMGDRDRLIKELRKLLGEKF